MEDIYIWYTHDCPSSSCLLSRVDATVPGEGAAAAMGHRDLLQVGHFWMVPGSSGNLDENWPLDASGKHTKSYWCELEHGPVEIVDLAIDSMVDLSIVFWDCLPEGSIEMYWNVLKCIEMYWNVLKSMVIFKGSPISRASKAPYETRTLTPSPKISRSPLFLRLQPAMCST